MSQGTITTLREGFGFIKVEGAGKDLFFHANELVDVAFDSLQVGDTVQFEVGEGQKGPQATKVSKV